MTRPAAVVTDIEGTTTAISFVHRVLFPYAAARLDAFLDARGTEPVVAAALAEAAADQDARGDVRAALHRWMAEDRKFGPLKTLQGLIWEDGFAAGTLRTHLYPDVAPELRAWKQAGVRLAVYSSGSVAAQRLLFGHSAPGDLAALFDAFFDTGVGAKRDRASYARIAAALALPPGAILFLSDVEQELDAARAAGLLTCQLVRAEDGTTPTLAHITAQDFHAVARAFGLHSAAHQQQGPDAMSHHAMIEDFAAMLRAGQHMEAAAKYNHPDIVSLEAMDGPMAEVRGAEAVRAKGEWWYANHEIHSATSEGPWPHGDQFIMRFTIDVTPKATGQRIQMEEYGLYNVRDGKIIEERFFYRTA